VPGFLPDTDVIVATVSRWHSHHAAAVTELNRRLDGGEPMLLAAPTLVDGAGYSELVHRLSERQIVGGRVYDAVIAACTERAGASTLLTFNVAHFRALLPPDVEVLAPSEL
jgi:predicted nucleic acid-binding protein